jgi:RNA polymerase sigma-70 factor, ECF subfamily
VSDDPFVIHRRLLFTVAYEMLGSRADAEDVLQDTWIRWARVERSKVCDPRRYLVRVVTRQALNHLRAVSRRREQYVGAWLPEPLLTDQDIADDVELAEGVSIAMLTVLETLGPTERAVFVLREVFDLAYSEIGEAVGKPEPTVRQIARRARAHVAARRPRMKVGQEEQRAVVEQLNVALETGRLQDLMEVLAPDVTLVADGGGLAPATLAPVHGRDEVATVLAAASRGGAVVHAKTVFLNALPAVRIDIDGRLAAAASILSERGLITHLYLMRNPRKLAHLDEAIRLTR